MPIFIGQFMVTAELLNKTAAPLIKERCPFVRELAFGFEGDRILARFAGRRSLLRFKGFAAAQLAGFRFGPAGYRAEMIFTLVMQPPFLKPFLVNLLRKELARLPGVSWSGRRLGLALDEMPHFLQLTRGAVWDHILSRIEITRGEREAGGGLLFNLYLHEDR